MRWLRQVGRASVWALVLLLMSSVALAQPTPAEKDEARQHARAGQQAFAKGDFVEAITRFEAAEAIIHAPPHLLFIARSKRELGKLAAAYVVYQQLVKEDLGSGAPAPFLRAQKEGNAELEALEPQLGRLFIEVSGTSDATIELDGEVSTTGTVIVDPGEHEVTARAAGYVTAVEKITVHAGGSPTRVTLKLSPIVPEGEQPEAPPPPEDDGFELMPILPWAVIGLGGAVLLVGAITGGVATAKVSDIRDQCPESPCSPVLADDKESATTFATASTVSFIVGGIIAAGGVSWLLVNILTTDDELGGHVTIRGTF